MTLKQSVFFIFILFFTRTLLYIETDVDPSAAAAVTGIGGFRLFCKIVGRVQGLTLLCYSNCTVITSSILLVV